MINEPNNDEQTANTEESADDTVSTLMNLAGPRADIPADIEKRVHENVRRHWQGGVKKRVVARWVIPAALAATILIFFTFNFRTIEIVPQMIGTIAYVSGDVDSNGVDFFVGDIVFAGDRIETVSGTGISITLKDDVSLRVAANSLVRLDQSDEITLFHGQIYADSGERIYRDRHLTVNTPAGSATDIGTQFAVAFDDGQMSVAVREGRVEVAHEQTIFSARAGDKLILQKGTDIIVDQVAPYDPYWDWAATLAPDFDVRNRSLLDFLKWAARETGKSLLFSDDEVRMAAMGTQVVGSIRNFSPDEAIGAVLATTQFDYEIGDQSITISK
jgi:hypothetical protein